MPIAAAIAVIALTMACAPAANATNTPSKSRMAALIALQNRNVTSGIKIGQKAPGFTLSDQNGRPHTLQQLMGPKGLLLVFVRSADW